MEILAGLIIAVVMFGKVLDYAIGAASGGKSSTLCGSPQDPPPVAICIASRHGALTGTPARSSQTVKMPQEVQEWLAAYEQREQKVKVRK